MSDLTPSYNELLNRVAALEAALREARSYALNGVAEIGYYALNGVAEIDAALAYSVSLEPPPAEKPVEIIRKLRIKVEAAIECREVLTIDPRDILIILNEYDRVQYLLTPKGRWKSR